MLIITRDNKEQSEVSTNFAEKICNTKQAQNPPRTAESKT